MCGIAGFWRTRDDDLLRRMTRALRHRGPDSEGFFTDGDASLGMRRLAVIDPEGGRQPVFGSSGRVALVFNGEIYNHPELRRALEAKGRRFKSRGDAEVLAHLYEEEGPGFVKALNGMYAVALWDGERRELFLFRDPLGVKPLYYAASDEGLAFASEIKALLEMPALSREIDPEALSCYLAKGSIPAPLSIFRSVRKLPPGHFLKAGPGGVQVEAYWTLPPPDAGFRLEDRRGEMESLLREAVQRQLLSDVPLGVFLSGGLDSSAVVAFAAPAISGRLKTFSIGYAAPDAAYNELDKARRVAERFNCDHAEFVLSPKWRDILPPLARAFDEPFANSSAIPTYLISREARRSVTVALTGVGGDELFGGYPRYAGLLLAERLARLPRVFRHGAGRLAGFLPDRGGMVNWTGRAKRFLREMDLPLSDQYDRWTSFLSPEWEERLRLAPFTARPSIFSARPPTVSSIAQRDLTDYLPSDLLCLTDRASMAHALEARVPFMDLPLVEFMARVPLTEKVEGGRLKSPLKAILAPHLPSDLIHQTKKGFAIPLARWLREEMSELLSDTLGEAQLRRRGLFDPSAVGRLREEHASGRENHADLLWGLLMLELWQREYADGKTGAVS